jgi:hypothetical protein
MTLMADAVRLASNAPIFPTIWRSVAVLLVVRRMISVMMGMDVRLTCEYF